MWLGEGVRVWMRNYNCFQWKKIAWNLSIAIFFEKKSTFSRFQQISLLQNATVIWMYAVLWNRHEGEIKRVCLFRSDFEACYVSLLLKHFDRIVSYSVRHNRAKVSAGRIILLWDIGAPLALPSLGGMRTCHRLWGLEFWGDGNYIVSFYSVWKLFQNLWVLLKLFCRKMFNKLVSIDEDL